MLLDIEIRKENLPIAVRRLLEACNADDDAVVSDDAVDELVEFVEEELFENIEFTDAILRALMADMIDNLTELNLIIKMFLRK